MSQSLRRIQLVVMGLLAIAQAAGQSAAQAAQSPVARPSADPIEGVWLGTVSAPQGTVADIGLEFFRTPKGTLVFRLNFPEMSTYGAPILIPVEVDAGGSYSITPTFNIRLHLDGDRLTGMFGLAQMPLELKRGGAFPPAPGAQSYPAAPAPLWRHSLGAPTWAPPTVRGDTVYVGASDGRMHAVRVTDGAEMWTWAGANRIDGPAAVGDDAVYFVDGKVNLVALDRASGALRWLTPLHDVALAGGPAPDNPTFNHRSAFPLLLDGVLYCGSSDGGLYAIAAANGKKLWRYDARSPIFSGVGRAGDDTLAFGTMDGSVVLLNRRTRRETMRARTGGGVVTVPLVVGDKVIAGSRDYMLYGFNLADGSVAWRFSYWFSWVESTPVLRDGTVYIGASDYAHVTALDPATGKPRWSTPVHGMNWGSPLVTANRVFTGTVSQNLAGTVIAHTGGIMALDRATGRPIWQLRMPAAPAGEFGGYAGSLALAGDKIIAAGFDGELVALPAG